MYQCGCCGGRAVVRSSPSGRRCSSPGRRPASTVMPMLGARSPQPTVDAGHAGPRLRGPLRRARGAVQPVDGVVLGRGDHGAADHERLGVDLAVHGRGEQLAEVRGRDRRRRERGLVVVPAGPQRIVGDGPDVRDGGSADGQPGECKRCRQQGSPRASALQRQRAPESPFPYVASLTLPARMRKPRGPKRLDGKLCSRGASERPSFLLTVHD